MVIRGEASGEVTATGVRTYFGKTAELLRAATTVSHLQAIIFTIVKYLDHAGSRSCAHPSPLFPASAVVHDGNAAVCPHVAGGLSSCSVPGDFPLATALGSMELAGSGVLVTRLSAIEDAAAMEMLCSAKPAPLPKTASQ